MDFTGQTVFITGGGGRIGRVVGRRFAEAGARVGLFGRMCPCPGICGRRGGTGFGFGAPQDSA